MRAYGPTVLVLLGVLLVAMLAASRFGKRVGEQYRVDVTHDMVGPLWADERVKLPVTITSSESRNLEISILPSCRCTTLESMEVVVPSNSTKHVEILLRVPQLEKNRTRDNFNSMLVFATKNGGHKLLEIAEECRLLLVNSPCTWEFGRVVAGQGACDELAYNLTFTQSVEAINSVVEADCFTANVTQGDTDQNLVVSVCPKRGLIPGFYADEVFLTLRPLGVSRLVTLKVGTVQFEVLPVYSIHPPIVDFGVIRSGSLPNSRLVTIESRNSGHFTAANLSAPSGVSVIEEDGETGSRVVLRVGVEEVRPGYFRSALRVQLKQNLADGPVLDIPVEYISL